MDSLIPPDNSQPEFSRRAFMGILGAVLAVSVLKGDYFQETDEPSGQTLEQTTTVPSEKPPTATRPTPTEVLDEASPEQKEKFGEPTRMTIKGLGGGSDVDASIETVGLDENKALGDPVGRRNIGVYKAEEGGYWPQPGSGKGRILTTGHTYEDGSGVYKPDFPKKLKIGMVVTITDDKGKRIDYSVTETHTVKEADYPKFAEKEGLYTTEGPESLLGVTCTDFDLWWGNHTKRFVFIAERVIS